MTTLAAPAFSAIPPSRQQRDTLGPTRYLYEVPRSEMDDQRAVSLSFGPGYPRQKRLVVEAVVAAINGLLRLPANWDAEGAARLSDVAAVTAIEWLELLVADDTAVPHVVPLRNGGLQFEWVVRGCSLEVEVAPDGDVGVLAVDDGGEPVIEGEYPHPDGTMFLDEARRFLASMFIAIDAT